MNPGLAVFSMTRGSNRLADPADEVNVELVGVFRYSPPPVVIPAVSATSVMVKVPLNETPFRVPVPVPVKM
jgi:hypothetical protein